jgi:hypothetical protein
MAVTLADVDKQLRQLWERRERAYSNFDLPELLIVETLIDGWLASRTALTTLQGATK